MQENVVEYNSAEHAIINSVDNSNSVINFNDADEINFFWTDTSKYKRNIIT